MKICFNIKHQYQDKYLVTYQVPLGAGQNLVLTSNVTYKGFTLRGLISQCKMAIRSRLYGVRKDGQELPMLKGIALEWDEKDSALQEKFQKQHAASMKTYIPVAKPVTEPTRDRSKDVWEVKRVEGVWTLVKHTKPYLTYEDAYKELVQKVLENENKD